jgi:hypothetical protein
MTDSIVTHAQISVAELANGWKRVHGRHPSNFRSGHEDDEGKLTGH